MHYLLRKYEESSSINEANIEHRGKIEGDEEEET